jgi:TolB protein
MTRSRAALVAAVALLAATCSSGADRTGVVTNLPSFPAPTSPPAPSTPVDVAGDRLLVLLTDGNLATMDPSGTAVLPLTSGAGPTFVVRQPVASPDGRFLAWVEIHGSTAMVVTASREGTARLEVPLRIAPFYLGWDPTSSRLVYLGSVGPAIGMGVIDDAVGEPTDIPIGGGAPLYMSWSPDGTAFIVHVGADGLGHTRLEQRLRPTGDAPGVFQAPIWLPDGRELYVVREGDRQRLLLVDGHAERVLRVFQGGMLLVASPDGGRLAYRLDRPDGSQDGVYVQDLDAGMPELVTRSDTTAFFWSPNGDALLLLTPEAGDPTGTHRWHVWNGHERFVSEPFLPSPAFSAEYLPFFDQYAQALTPWAPDGSAFAFAGSVDAEPGVWVQRVAEGAVPTRVADGEFVVWTPSPAELRS